MSPPPIKPPLLPASHPATQEGLLRQVLGAVERQNDTLMETNQRVIGLETRMDEFEGRLMRNSSHVRNTSNNDMRQDAAIAAIAAKLDANTGLTEDVKKSVTSIAKHPAVLSFLVALVTYATMWLKAHT